jgi:ribosome-binding factor A
MPRTSNRLNRIGDQLKQELARLIQNELRDPRLGLVSVMEVRVSRDLAHAEVFITVLNADPPQAVTTLNNAGGLLRSLLAKNLNLRVTPRLKFVFDESVERGRHLSWLIDEALAQDARHPGEGEKDKEEPLVYPDASEEKLQEGYDKDPLEDPRYPPRNPG